MVTRCPSISFVAAAISVSCASIASTIRAWPQQFPLCIVLVLVVKVNKADDAGQNNDHKEHDAETARYFFENTILL